MPPVVQTSSRPGLAEDARRVRLPKAVPNASKMIRPRVLPASLSHAPRTPSPGGPLAAPRGLESSKTTGSPLSGWISDWSCCFARNSRMLCRVTEHATAGPQPVVPDSDEWSRSVAPVVDAGAGARCGALGTTHPRRAGRSVPVSRRRMRILRPLSGSLHLLPISLRPPIRHRRAAWPPSIGPVTTGLGKLLRSRAGPGADAQYANLGPQ
jgi:hypothetical protein